MDKERFTTVIDGIMKLGLGVKVFVKTPGLEKLEVISNPKENVAAKREYYLEKYDNQMRLKSFPQIQIVSITGC